MSDEPITWQTVQRQFRQSMSLCWPVGIDIEPQQRRDIVRVWLMGFFDALYMADQRIISISLHDDLKKTIGKDWLPDSSWDW